MKFVEQNGVVLGLAPSKEQALLEMIELAGRTCYKSEHKITEESYKLFFKKMLVSGHHSVLEHGNICFMIDVNEKSGMAINLSNIINTMNIYNKGSFVRVYSDNKRSHIISANVRTWVELIAIHLLSMTDSQSNEFLVCFAGFKKHYPFITDLTMNMIYDTKEDADRVMGIMTMLIKQRHLDDDTECTVRIIPEEEQLELFKSSKGRLDLPIIITRSTINRGISHEAVRNRALSVSQESTRYVNYRSREDIGIRYIPLNDFLNPDITDECKKDRLSAVERLFSDIEQLYNRLTDDTDGKVQIAKPQIARNILPNALATEIVLSGRISVGPTVGKMDLGSGWSHFFKQRCSPGAHPEMVVIAKQLKEKFIEQFDLGDFI